MSGQLAAFITGEGNWLPMAMALALVAAATSMRQRDRVIPAALIEFSRQTYFEL